ncbi:MAG: class I SAM-dependent methyltransferase [Burkholderiales bacterium]|nr:class I SAM-dependent methyltransferase [Burkholderiales bacterium]
MDHDNPATTDLASLPEHVRVNRATWDTDAPDWVAPGERAWATTAPSWGIWNLPESELHLLPADMHGLTAIELGCGTGYVSAWMTRRGARVTAIDNSARQLDTARRLAAEHGLTDIRSLHGNAEQVPLPDASFDFAFSEYGAAIWCDPHVWIPEAHRLLRPGGELVFLGHHPLAVACSPLDGAPTGQTLVRDWFTLHRVDWRHVEIDPGGIEFNLPVSAWFALFKRTGFELLDYLELQAPDPAAGDAFGATAAWSRRYPSEQVWRVRKRR